MRLLHLSRTQTRSLAQILTYSPYRSGVVEIADWYSSSTKVRLKAARLLHSTFPTVHTQSPLIRERMADDASYNAFLTKANEDLSTTSSQKQATSQAKPKFDPTAPQVSSVPSSLQDLNATYTSDSDEPFEPVILDYASSELPDAKQFAKCLKRQAKVEVLSISDFDGQGQYTEIIMKVKEAGNGDVKVYRLEVSVTRAEYYVMSVGQQKLVGVRARAVES